VLISTSSGFSFPFFVWRDKGKLWVLDGHQRDKTLKRLEQDGWKVPLLPVDYIEAGNQKEAKEKIRSLGGEVSESVYAKTDFVVTGKEPGSKYEKAKALGVEIISEKEFLGIYLTSHPQLDNLLAIKSLISS